jgi:hypothetical protein
MMPTKFKRERNETSSLEISRTIESQLHSAAMPWNVATSKELSRKHNIIYLYTPLKHAMLSICVEFMLL